MGSRNILSDNTIKHYLEKYPFLSNFLDENNIEIKDRGITFDEYFAKFTEEELEDKGIDLESFKISLVDYVDQMIEFLGIEEEEKVKSLTIYPGTDKDGVREKYDELKINSSEIICIVGPTGSGKSRLLADIEWTAQNDTPTSRVIKINEKEPDKKWRYSSSNKLVAQLSQNMNFVMDLSVYEFLELHAKSRLIENQVEIIEKIIKKANELAGEKFDPSTQITSLSGGQSRALMIADTAILSASPIVLIDEIENAGIDRKKALELLVGEEKIVLMATHDPLLALMGDRRIVINNGAIQKIVKTTVKEKEILKEIEAMDNIIQSVRHRLRYGEEIDKI